MRVGRFAVEAELYVVSCPAKIEYDRAERTLVFMNGRSASSGIISRKTSLARS